MVTMFKWTMDIRYSWSLEYQECVTSLLRTSALKVWKFVELRPAVPIGTCGTY